LETVAEKPAGLLVSAANAQEAAVVEGLTVYRISRLTDAVSFLSGQVELDPESVDQDEVFRQLSKMEYNFVGVKGQEYSKCVRS
jgi:magnesium chelatase family protein